MLHYVENLTTSESKEVVSNFIKEIKLSPKYLYFDTETTGLDFFTDRIILLQFKLKEDVYVFNRSKVGDAFIIKLFELINQNDITLVGHNIKFDVKMLKGDLKIAVNKVFDTLIAEVVINSGVGKKLYSLADLFIKYVGIELSKEVRETFYNTVDTENFSNEQIDYAATDVLYLDSILEQQVELINEKQLNRTIDLEMEIVPHVCDMEMTGVKLDKEYHSALTEKAIELSKNLFSEFKDLLFSNINLRKYGNLLELARAFKIPVTRKRDIAELESITDVESGATWIKEKFNQNSPNQMLAALNLAGIATKSTNEKVLNKLPKNPIIEKLLEMREVEKLISTYGYNLIELVHPKTGRIHTEYFQVGTKTGRFSSGKPNMQNLPRKGGYREGFIAEEGYSFISMDYSQQEYRLVGAISKEPKIIEAYVKGSDMHTATAALRFNKPLEEVTSEERNYGKTMNFAILYGTTEYGLMKNFSVSKEEALGMLDDFYKGYPQLTSFKEMVEDKISKLRYSITPLGRKRFFEQAPIFGTPRELEKMESEVRREGFNMIIQGGGADVTKIAMLNIAKRNPFGHDKFHMLLQVHDELVCEVHDSLLEEGEHFMRTCMLEAFQPLLGEIPAKVDSRISKRWGKG